MIKKTYLTLLLILVQFSTFAGINIIPEPVKVEEGTGIFTLTQATPIFAADDAKEIGLYLSAELQDATGFRLNPTTSKSTATGITLEILATPNSEIGDQGYLLESTTTKIVIQANTKHGLFNGVQTLLQLLPPEIEASTQVKADWIVPAVKISDYPRFEWRGLMLDVSRHFFTVEDVKNYIDEMARYKFNRFHWHLTDDQGWRIEIKGLPKLTEIGAWRVPRQGDWWSFDPPQKGEAATYGGFYTQEEVKEIVKYAQDRFITILPEVDIPGHAMAMLAAYPELACFKKDFKVNPGSKFFCKIQNTLCAGNPKTFEYLNIVFSEIADLFPSEYIHIGGDEVCRKWWFFCTKCQSVRRKNKLKNTEEIQSYFITEVEKMLNAKGKSIIGWDEILDGGLAPNATVMSWRGTAGGIKAASMGHKVIMSPMPYYYLDLYQGDPLFEPVTYAMARLTDTYNFEPVPAEVDEKYVMGIQGCLWTESVSEYRHAQYMTWPRAFAIAESSWTPTANKDWTKFIAKTEHHFKRFDQRKIRYARSMYDPIVSVIKEDGKLKIKMETEFEGLTIHYTFQGAEPDFSYPVYDKPVTIPRNPKLLRVVTYKEGKQVGNSMVLPIDQLKARAGF
ncbi:MAG: family 20 glycosylhydrolase [Spirochaetales bacterium]|nr:family 20 glycosylhydrolase [Spirochaetales bacterium]